MQTKPFNFMDNYDIGFSLSSSRALLPSSGADMRDYYETS